VFTKTATDTAPGVAPSWTDDLTKLTNELGSKALNIGAGIAKKAVRSLIKGQPIDFTREVKSAAAPVIGDVVGAVFTDPDYKYASSAAVRALIYDAPDRLDDIAKDVLTNKAIDVIDIGVDGYLKKKPSSNIYDAVLADLIGTPTPAPTPAPPTEAEKLLSDAEMSSNITVDKDGVYTDLNTGISWVY
jgi:hypothetical protein